MCLHWKQKDEKECFVLLRLLKKYPGIKWKRVWCLQALQFTNPYLAILFGVSCHIFSKPSCPYHHYPYIYLLGREWRVKGRVIMFSCLNFYNLKKQFQLSAFTRQGKRHFHHVLASLLYALSFLPLIFKTAAVLLVGRWVWQFITSNLLRVRPAISVVIGGELRVSFPQVLRNWSPRQTSGCVIWVGLTGKLS